MTAREVVCRIDDLIRLQSSVNGNPRFDLLVSDRNGVTSRIYRTKPDASVGYEIENHRGRWVKLTLDARRRVIDVERTHP